jgi:aspartokinase-like uncharacterized kinase
VRIDAVIKIGGSLARTRTLRVLLDSIAGCLARARIVVVPGGGPFADLVRAEHHRLEFSEGTAHRMAILAMDQYGLLLADLAPRALPVSRLGAIGTALSSGRLPIFLPSRSLLRRDPFDPSWDVTSDSIAAYIATLVKAKALLLLKDVDGVFARDPKRDPTAPLLRRVSRSRLARYHCVDRQFARWARGIGSCWIINGTKPARLREWLQRGETLGTRVVVH